MKRRALILLFATLLMAVCVSSCAKRSSQRISISGIEQIERKGWSGIEALIVVENSSHRNIYVDSCRIHLTSGTIRLGSLELRGGAYIPKQSEERVTARFKLQFPTVGAIQSLWRRFAAGDTQRIGVMVEGRARSGAVKRTFSTEITPLSEILNIFDIDNNEFSIYFKE